MLSYIIEDILFPPVCPLCGEIIDMEKRLPLYRENARKAASDCFACSGCLSKIKYFNGPAVPLGKSGRRYLDGCMAAAEYDDLTAPALAAVKYHSQKAYLDFFAALMEERLGEWIKASGFSCMVAVPVHRKRLRKRGYDQAKELAARLSPRLDLPVRNDMLVRTVNTTAMKELDPQQRAAALSGAFKAAKRPVTGERILLVDDIYTTGATMEASASVLKKAGAGIVCGACICAVPAE